MAFPNGCAYMPDTKLLKIGSKSLSADLADNMGRLSQTR